MSVIPTPDQLRAFVERGPDGPVHMLNLLRFRERADYPPETGHAPCSGAEAYARYGEQVLPLLKRVGATVAVLGQCHAPVIGEDRDHFDHMVIVHYPDRQALLNMMHSEDYKRVAAHRSAAVAHSLLIPMTDLDNPGLAQTLR